MMPKRSHAISQIDVDPRAKPNHADALAGAEGCALAYKADNPACDEPGDLHHCDAAIGRRDDKGIALIVLARLVEVGVQEGAMMIDDALNLAGRRTAIDVAVEHAHENRDPRQRPL